MKQILAIFTKDVRRFWPEILISTAMLVALVALYPRQWRGLGAMSHASFGGFLASTGAADFFAQCLIVLIPIAWWVLIARLIHCERLIGHTQFWITRPYERPKLLAAKLLFLAVFIYVPFFVAQCLLLYAGGFQPFSWLPGLLLNLFFVTAFIVLPLASLSALTTGFGRMTLLLLGLALFIGLASTVTSLLPSSAARSAPDLVSGNLLWGILFCGCAAIIFVQYVRHRVRLAWFLLAAIALMMWGVMVIDPDQALIDGHFPPQATAPVQIVYAASALNQPGTYQTNTKGMLSIAIPVRESDVAEGEAVIPVALKVNLEAPGRAGWQSAWQGVRDERYLPGVSNSTLRFVLPDAVYERFKSAPVTLRITFAMVQARRSTATSVALPQGDFSVAGLGVCRPQAPFGELKDYYGIACRSAMNQPQLTHITAQWTNGHCADSSAQPGPQGLAWVGALDRAAAEFGLTPVWNTPVNFSGPQPYSFEDIGRYHLCPGSLVTFTQFREAARMQTDLVVPNFQFPELSLGDQYMRIRPAN